MPNGREHLKYEDFGSHLYYSRQSGTSDCEYGCGCWMGPARSGGPAGVDPFGKCPGNVQTEIPVSFNAPLSEKEIQQDFINGRIAYLEKLVRDLRPFKETVENAEKFSNVGLVTEFEGMKRENIKLANQLQRIKDQLAAIWK